MTSLPASRSHGYWLLTLSLLLLLLPNLPVSAAPAAPLGIYFDDSSPDRILVGNGYYEVAFRKSNGSIESISVPAGRPSLTAGSRWECLWGAVLSGSNEFAGGCHYRQNTENWFDYQWFAATNTLLLKYEVLGVDGPPVGAEVEVRLTDQRWLDMRIQIRNYSQRTVERVLFPCDLVFRETEIQEAVLPVLPGMALEPAFWAEDRSYVRQYPGWPGLFADFVSIQTANGGLSIYTLPRDGAHSVEPAYLGFIHDDDARQYVPDSTYYHHTFGTWIAPRSSWVSPWVRVLLGGNWLADAKLVRQHTGLDAYPSLTEKLGARFDSLVRLPLYKADAVHLDRPFSDYAALFDRIPYPGLLHPVAWQPGGHDENYPDLLPPDSRWGTTADMAAMFRAAQARGFEVMPYSNLTWWDDQGPTLTNLPPEITLSDVAVIKSDGAPFWQSYGSHGGYVVSPWSPFVITRIAQLVNDLAALGSDWQFWDQVGAREWPYDFNRYAPDPTSYMAGWLRLSQAHRVTGLMTEMGYDRLAATMIGFHGSVLLPERQGTIDVEHGWHDGLWRPVPLASALFGDKVLLYQHDLAPETMTHDKATLTWNMAMGYMLSADLAHAPGGVDGDWLAAVGALQRYAVSRYAGRAVTGYDARFPPSSSVSRTFFGNCTVLANWDERQEQSIGPHTLVAGGVHLYCPEEDATRRAVTAGVYSRFNGGMLSAGDHVIIEERSDFSTTIRHPLGSDTVIVAAYPLKAVQYARYRVEAFDYDGKPLGNLTAPGARDGVPFFAARQWRGEPVEHYRITQLPLTFLPLVAR